MSTDELNRKPEVREILAEVIATHADQIGTHYGNCYRRHAGCLAVLLRDMLEQQPATTAGPFRAVLAAQKSGKTNAMLEQLIAAAAGRNIEVTVHAPISEAELTQLIMGRTAPQAARAVLQHMKGMNR